ncbi:integrator complex subunit 15-like [Corticium candelabrum]|uniref:integrator complex subunit 15-like n=1 Tax=Corticium candelabrum TaxID=121492 RepID=UPI002E360B5D|nr:integrator complex subunit 15-like [Corticium candelabrum]
MKRTRGSPAQKKRAKKARVDVEKRQNDHENKTKNRTTSDASIPDIISWQENTVASLCLRLNEDLKSAGFPKSTQESLHILRHYFTRHQQLNSENWKNRDVIDSLVTTFIFNTHRTAKPDRAAITTLHILQMICSCLNDESDENVRVRVFNCLFPPNISGDMLKLEAQLVSLAISCGLSRVLDVVAWCMLEEHAAHTGRVIITDFCCLLPSMLPNLQNVLKSSPSMAARLLTSFTYIFDITSATTRGELLPLSLLSVVTEWVHSQPMLPYDRVSTPSCSLFHPVLSHSTSSSLPVTGLIVWTVLGPLSHLVGVRVDASWRKHDVKRCGLFSRLHTSILRGAVEYEHRGMKADNVWLRKHVTLHTSHVIKIAERLAMAAAAATSEDGELIQLAVDRFAQAIQLLQSCQLLDIKSVISDLNQHVDKIPSNRLLHIVLSHWTKQQ